MNLRNNHGFPILIFFFLLLTIGFYFGCSGKQASMKEKWSSTTKVSDIQKRLAQFVPTEISYDESLLNEEQKQVLEKLVLAAKQMDKIFWKQASHTGLILKKELEEMDDPENNDFLRYVEINFGPYDRLDENKPFIGEKAKSPGAGFYPEDLTSEQFQAFITSNPDKKKELEDTYTVVKRKDDSLIAVPYNEEYREDLEPASRYLKEAAEITTNASLKKFLNQRAADLLSNDYYQSDSDWIDLEDNLIEIVIGPFEVYEDALNGLKAAYEAFVYINDFEEMEKIEGYLKFLDEMQRTLPVAQKYKDQDVAGLLSPLNVANEVFTAGDTKAGVQTLAFVLPNDERIREEKGTKKVFLKNVMEAKFNQILVPISKTVLSEADAENVSFWAYFNEVVLHEICHALGVNYVTNPDGTKTTVKVPPEAINFDQVKVGDMLKAILTEQVVVYIDDAGASVPDGYAAGVALAPKGAQPVGIVAETVQITATVTAIDQTSRKATLRFEDGSVKTLPVRDDIDLSQHAVGEKVVFVVTEIVALSVEKP